jgi:glycosyltransferase involved in cell wall biosynthesis
MKLAVCVIVKNEGDGILEWGLYHRLIGFDALIIVDDHSADDTVAEVQKLSQAMEVHRHTYRRLLGDTQNSVYYRVCRNYFQSFDWIAFIDADEFIFSPHATDIRSLLSQQSEQVAAIGLPWVFFGSSCHETKPDSLVLDAYSHRAAFDKFDPHRHVKSIVRPAKVKRCINPHAFEVDGMTVGPDGKELVWAQKSGILVDYADYSSWRINHYFTKSRQNWTERLVRGQLGSNTKRTPEQFKTYDRNEVKDDSAAPAAERVRAQIDALSLSREKR